jgi:hypothetical protein
MQEQMRIILQVTMGELREGSKRNRGKAAIQASAFGAMITQWDKGKLGSPAYATSLKTKGRKGICLGYLSY